MMPLILASAACGVLVLAFYLTFTHVKSEKKPESVVSDDYRIEFGYDLGDHDKELARESEMRTRKYQLKTKSLYDRVLKGILAQALIFANRFTPHTYIERTAAKMRHAGKRGPEELDRFLAIRAITGAVGIAFVVITIFIAQGSQILPGIPIKTQLAMFGFLALLAFGGPEAQLNREADSRKLVVQQTLPDVLDLLTISVEAGLGFEQAIQYVADMMEGPLCDEFNRMNAEMRAGASRAVALKALDERVGVEDVGHFVLAILQADRFGVSIARILRSQADEMRVKRHMLAQEMAQKAPVKMLVPMTIFIFPPLFIVVLGPAIMSIAANFGSA